MVFHRSLSDNKPSQISRTLLSILADLNNVIYIVSTCPIISKFSIPFPVQNGSSSVQNGNSSFQNGNNSVQNGKIIISINIKKLQRDNMRVSCDGC